MTLWPSGTLMFHTASRSSGYGCGKLGEVKLPYGPVSSTLREAKIREDSSKTPRQLELEINILYVT